MKRMKLVGIFLTVALAAVAVAAGTAVAAEPTFTRVTVSPVKEGESIAFTSTSKQPSSKP